MSRERKNAHPTGERARAHNNNNMVAQDERKCLTAYYLFLAATLLYGFLILLHDQSII